MATKFVKCAHSHPALPVGEYKIYGGSCYDPIVEDADIYVGLDGGMPFQFKQMPPWHNPPIEFLFRIPDMQAPPHHGEFAELITWLAEMLVAGKKIHVGCIGGHGRTGTVFAALVKVMTGNEDATQFVRDNYCAKAVESNAQIDFLEKHYGIKRVLPTKMHMFAGDADGYVTKKPATPKQQSLADWALRNKREEMAVGSTKGWDVKPSPLSPLSIWGANTLFDKPAESVIIEA